MTLVSDPPPSSSPAGSAAAADVAVLRGVLAALRGQTRRWIWLETAAWLGLLAAAFFWASLAFDWWVEPPRWARGVLLAAVAVGLLAIVRRKLLARLAAELGDSSLAIVVERTHPSFRDSLSTAIELADQPAAETNPTLLARTAAEARANLGQVRPERIFRRRELAMLAFAAVVAVASVVALAVVRPATAGTWARRLALLGDEPWPRLVRLAVDGFPGGVRKVARGGDVEVIVQASAPQRVPEVVDLRWRTAADAPRRGGRQAGPWHVDRMGTRGGVTADGQAFGHVLKGVGESLDLEIRGGDARLRGLRLEVLEPPALDTLVITTTPPAYLGGGPRPAAPARIVQLPGGSRVDIRCTSTKPLSAATMVANGTSAASADGETLASLSAGGTPAAPVRTIEGRIEPLLADCTIVVRFTDTDGLVNREPVTFVLAVLPDEPPQVALRLRGISTAVTPRARLPLVGTISDDHGLASATVSVRTADGAESSLPLARVRAGDALVEFPAQTAEVVALEPLAGPLQLAVGRTIQVSVRAADACTIGAGANVGASDVWSLDVVAPETLVAMLEAREIILRRRYESCVADLTQARDAFAAPPAAEPAAGGGDDDRGRRAGGLGEATARAAGETAELAEAFRDIRLEFDNNQLLTPELETRLVAQIAEPLAAIAARDLPALATACRGRAGRQELLRKADEVLARMRAVLDKMMELESFNEVVELLRGMIRTQEQIRAETLEQQKRRAREALERP